MLSLSALIEIELENLMKSLLSKRGPWVMAILFCLQFASAQTPVNEELKMSDKVFVALKFPIPNIVNRKTEEYRWMTLPVQSIFKYNRIQVTSLVIRGFETYDDLGIRIEKKNIPSNFHGALALWLGIEALPQIIEFRLYVAAGFDTEDFFLKDLSDSNKTVKFIIEKFNITTSVVADQDKVTVSFCPGQFKLTKTQVNEKVRKLGPQRWQAHPMAL